MWTAGVLPRFSPKIPAREALRQYPFDCRASAIGTMDSGALLDLLGNKNRRRILRLLAQKPCYVTEISEYLDVSPKAVIDHLRKLEEAGLVESRTDENRRKYFYIANDVRLEVNVSRFGYGAKSAYPASSTLDLGSCQHLSVNLERSPDAPDATDLGSLAKDLRELEELANELSLAQRFVQGRLIELIERIAERTEADATELMSGRLSFEILLAIANGHRTIDAIASQVDVPNHVLRDALDRFRQYGVLEHSNGEWTFAG